MTPEEERRCWMLADLLVVTVRDLVCAHIEGSAFRCRICGGVSTREVCPRCELASERKQLSEQIKEARA